MIQTVLSWLRGYPGLEQLRSEALGSEPGSAGLFFRGLTLQRGYRDLLGREFRRRRLEFYLERHCAGDSGTQWLQEFSCWAEANAPALGENSSLTCSQGQLIHCDETAISRCRLQLTFEFTQVTDG